ncbi:hypothetical protein BDR06DRAFT_420949 [Suillus hirtellus]|nr:hypothetical protein BDR06DRAFT_420949 [Suillus hirtellus]
MTNKRVLKSCQSRVTVASRLSVCTSSILLLALILHLDATMDASSHQPDILAIAREQLGLQKHVKDASIPKSYLAALRRHLDIDPYDTNFRVTLQPKTGYGVVTCLEQACAAINIPLGAGPGRSGGKADGFGSLVNYTV